MNEQMELKIQRELELKEFELRSISEAEEKSKEIAEEIKAVLRKHGASLAEWNNNLYIVPPGFQVYSVWNFPIGVRLDPLDVGLTCERYDCDYRIIKPGQMCQSCYFQWYHYTIQVDGKTKIVGEYTLRNLKPAFVLAKKDGTEKVWEA